MQTWPLPRRGLWNTRQLRNRLQGRSFSTSRAASDRFRVSSLLNHTAPVEDVEVCGWIRSVRRQKKVAFIALGDGSTLDPLQAILRPDQTDGLSHGTAAQLRGSWVRSSGREQSHELQVSAVRILGDNDAEHSPIQPKYQTLEYLRTVPHLRPRIPANALLLRLRSRVIAALTKWFDEQGFVQCHTPVISSSDCEGAGEVFTVKADDSAKVTAPGANENYFRTPKYLTVSAQLHLEALAQAVDRVWTLSPTFRAEESDTSRHLSEFYMLEAELCFTEDVTQVMDVVENMLRALAKGLKDSPVVIELLQSKLNAAESAEGADVVAADVLEGRWHGMASPSWPRISYAQAIDLLTEAHSSGKAGFSFPPSYGDGLAAEHERYIAATVGQGSPVFVMHYPRVQKPFYMPPSLPGVGSDDTVACFDLLVPDLCELVGGSLREHRLDALQASMEAKGVNGKGLDWYQDLKRYGSVPHGGFGLGFDRLLCYLAGVSNLRDVVAFPRWVGRCEC